MGLFAVAVSLYAVNLTSHGIPLPFFESDAVFPLVATVLALIAIRPKPGRKRPP